MASGFYKTKSSRTVLERSAKEGDSPVDERLSFNLKMFPEYYETREIL